MLTFITPIAPRHIVKFPRCAESVKAQTVPVVHLYAHDEKGAGPSPLRNAMLREVKTPYVAFLDSDDWIEPDFAEKMIAAMKPGMYAYSDWWEGDKHIAAPEKAWCGGSWHVVTAVLPTQLAQSLKFDETLPAIEDSDFFIRVIRTGTCGVPVHLPLFHYAPGGGRAEAVHLSGEIVVLKAVLQNRYGGSPMACCGADMTINQAPVGEKQDGDVMAQAMWRGNRKEFGRKTARRYPRMSWPQSTWVDPQDVAAAPQMWQIIPQLEGSDAEASDPPLFGVDGLARYLQQIGVYRSAPPSEAHSPTQDSPNYARVVRLEKRHYGEHAPPAFVMPLTDYPSYADFWRLVQLSGFDIVHPAAVRWDDPASTYIVVSPEGVADYSLSKARIIFWQLEYTGDYTHQLNRDTCNEQWSSDPHYAKLTDAKYVPLGSHPGLAEMERAAPESMEWDVVMLAYMTGRRQAWVDHWVGTYKMPPDYPGHSGDARAHQLTHSRMMAIVHQNEEPALAPIRLALAASYKLPVVSEEVPGHGIYHDAVVWVRDSAAMDRVLMASEISSYGSLEDMGQTLYQLLCVKHPFRSCVMEALGFAEHNDEAPALIQQTAQSTPPTTPTPPTPPATSAPAPSAPPMPTPPVAVQRSAVRVVGAMELHYGADYLEYALKSVADYVDQFSVFYTPVPNRNNAQTVLTCPDSREQLRAIADSVLGDKLDWHEGDFAPGIGTALHLNSDAECVLMLDSDEIIDVAMLGTIEEHLSMGNPAHPNYGLPFLHYWRSFRHVCNDEQIYPVRVYHPRVAIDTYPTGHVIRGGYVHHFGYARSLEDMRYKMALSMHRDQFRPDWWEKFLSYPQMLDDVHPEIFNFWYAKNADQSLLPAVMQNHPYFGREVIE